MADVTEKVNIDVNLNTDNALKGLEELDSEAEKVVDHLEYIFEGTSDYSAILYNKDPAKAYFDYVTKEFKKLKEQAKTFTPIEFIPNKSNSSISAQEKDVSSELDKQVSKRRELLKIAEATTKENLNSFLKHGDDPFEDSKKNLQILDDLRSKTASLYSELTSLGEGANPLTKQVRDAYDYLTKMKDEERSYIEEVENAKEIEKDIQRIENGRTRKIDNDYYFEGGWRLDKNKFALQAQMDKLKSYTPDNSAQNSLNRLLEIRDTVAKIVDNVKDLKEINPKLNIKQFKAELKAFEVLFKDIATKYKSELGFGGSSKSDKSNKSDKLVDNKDIERVRTSLNDTKVLAQEVTKVLDNTTKSSVDEKSTKAYDSFNTHLSNLVKNVELLQSELDNGILKEDSFSRIKDFEKIIYSLNRQISENSIDIIDPNAVKGVDALSSSIKYLIKQLTQLKIDANNARLESIANNKTRSLPKDYNARDEHNKKFKIGSYSEQDKIQPGMSTERALLELESSLTDEQRRRIDLAERAHSLQRQEEEARRRTAESINTENANIASEIEKLKSDFNELNKTYEEMFKTGDFSGLNSASNKLDELNRKGEELSNRISNLGRQSSSAGVHIDTSHLSESLRDVNTYAEGIVSNISDNMRTHILDKTKKGISTISKIAKDSVKSTFNVAKKAVSTYFNTLRSMFSSLFGWVKSRVSKLFSGKEAASGLSSELKSLLGVAGITTLIKKSIDLASSMLEVQNVTDSVFKSLSSDIDDFTENAVQKFGLTQLKAKEMIGVFGGMLGASNVVGKAQAEMSKNLTALAGDVASFYNMDIEAAFKKLQSGLAGNTAAMRSLGVNMTVANLEAFALSRGINTSYREMNQATKTTLRYNYMLNQLAVAQGDFSRTSYTWANQVRLLKNSFSQLFSILGGAVVKFLLPVVQILNQIVAAAINVANALAKAFGFRGIDLKEFAGSTGAALPDIEDTTDALDDESDALDKTGKSAKKASENLQGFDKLNNITSETASGSGGAGGAGGAGSLIDFDSYYDKVDDITKDNKLQQWLEDLYSLMADGKWKEAGQKIAKALNDITDAAYDWLTAAKRYKDIKKFNKAMTDFADGLLDYDFKKLGKTVGAGINLITFAINDLYEQATDKDLLKRTGKSISKFFLGLHEEVDWESAGKSLTTGFRSAMDLIRGFFDDAEANNLAEKLGGDIKTFIIGACKRLFDNGGAEEIGNNIASLLNFAFDLISNSIGDKEALDSISKGVVTTINTAIKGINKDKLSKATSAILNLFASIFHSIGEIDTDTLSTDIADAINGAVDDGSVENLASGITSAIANLFNLIGKTIDKVDKSSLGSAIIKGISDGLSNTEGESYLIKAFSILFGVKLLGSVGQFGLGLLGNSIIKALAGSFTGNAAASTTISSMASIFTVQNAAKFGLKGAVVAMAISLGKTLVDGVKDGVDQTVATEDILDGMRDDLKGTITLSVDPSAYSNLQEYRDKLKELKGTYDNISNLVNDISFGEDNLTSIRDLTAYLDELEKAGAGGSTQFKNLKKAIDDYNNASILDKSAAFDNVYSLAQDLSLEFETTVDTIDSLNDIQFNALDENFSKLKQNTKFSESEVNELTITWANAGEQLSKGLLDKVNETVDNDTTVDTSVKDLVTGATNESNTGDKSKGNAVGTRLTAGVTSAINANTSVKSATSSLVTTATSDSNTGATSKAQATGKLIGTGLGDGAKAKSEYLKGALRNLATLVSNDADIKWTDKAKAAGGFVIDGIQTGLEAKEKTGGLLGAIAGVANRLLDKFKSVLGIHSPSRVFKGLAEFIPAGAAEGIESGADVAYDAVSEFSDELRSKFDNDTIDTTEMLDLTSLFTQFEDAKKKASLFADSLASSLTGIQSEFTIQPAFKKAEMESIIAQRSTSDAVTGGLSNIYSRLGGIARNQGGNMQVSVYLDANNKLGDFIINTVNGQVIKGGNF